ncbi:MAG: CPBP family intramembrane glutamic endopeptidase [Flavobacterium sp.]
MFIQQAVSSENKFWKYLLGSVVVAMASFIGQLPLMVAILINSYSTGTNFPTNSQDITSYLDSNLTLFLVMLSFVFAILALFGWQRVIHKQSILNMTTSRSKVDWGRILFSFTIWAIFLIAVTSIDYFLDPTEYQVNFRLIPFLILVLIGVIFIPIQTSAEEYIFRGYLMQGFGILAGNRWFPLMMTSLIFGLMHIVNPEVAEMGYIIMIYYIGTGLFLGILTLMDEGIELSLGFHAANNLIGALLVTADWSAFKTNSILLDMSAPTAGFDVVLPVFVIFPILLFIFSKKYGWTSWSEKLFGKINLKE